MVLDIQANMVYGGRPINVSEGKIALCVCNAACRALGDGANKTIWMNIS